MPFAQLKVSEKQHNGEDATITQNLFKLEAGLQFKRECGNKNMGFDHLHTPIPASKDYTVSATLSPKYIPDYSLNR